MRKVEIKNALSELWQAQAMAEIISNADLEKADPITIQTTVRCISKFILDGVMTLEEEL
ncbi:hypothetical protein PTQ27_05280 [Mannheimia sp. AT1]|uniref:Uncharacterized protein n=1 Tax=Mannheimia cairinae TaxID=3025936 RepID=A0ABT5MNY0_9PAST|nr:hypothetical protein [Mannheimia cairinae]MDD0823879.1 hypothetical protein [Mannheimia cairinae]MDD0825195.1 hypothetical protein [Mannheimia cairinae]